LGISDDIRPKKFKPIPKKIVETEIKIAQKKIEQIDDAYLFDKQHDGDFFDGTPINEKREIKHQNQNKNHKKLYAIISVFLCFFLIGLLIWQNFSFIKNYINGSYKNESDKNLSDIVDETKTSDQTYESSAVSNSSDVPAQTTQPVAPAIDKSTIIISVLNGSGIKNAAAEVTGVLTNAGFTVKTTSNAKSFNYLKTYIYYKTNGLEKANLIRDTLTSRETEISESPIIVGSNYDIVIVVGKN
jgi:cytoskeletal protein RodZ